MASSYEKVLAVISKKPSQRQDFEIQSLLPWLRKMSTLFQELKTDCLKDIVRNCSVKSFKKDDIIIKQGERGDCFYIILAGKISIFIINKDKDGASGDEMAALAEIGSRDKDGHLDRSKLGNFATSLGSGIPFGEVALMSEDCIRTASIIAEEQTFLLVVNRTLYERCVSSVLAAEFQEKQTFIENNPLFKSWMPRYKKQLAMAMYKETWPFDSVLVRQGDPVTNIYYVISGQVEIRTDPVYHPVQYPQFYKLLEDEREKLIKEKKQRPQQHDTEAHPQHKKRDNSRILRLCYFGINESLDYIFRFIRNKKSPPFWKELLTRFGVGEIETLLDMDTYIQTAVCAEQTEVLVLEMKHYERLFARRHQRTIEIMRHNLEQKLNTRTSVLSAKENEKVPLLGLIHMKLNILHNPPPTVTEKKKKKETSVQWAEKLFFKPKGPLLDVYGPGSVFYMIRVREQSKLKLKAHQKEGLKSKQQDTDHVHTITLPQSLLNVAKIAGATETKVGATDNAQGNEIEVVEYENMPQRKEHIYKTTNSKVSTYTQKNIISPRSFRCIQSAVNPKQTSHDEFEDITRHYYNVQEHKSLPSSRPYTRFEKGDQELRLGILEEKVKDWLSRDNPKASANVSKLRRLHVEEMNSKPKPGNKIVIRRRRKVRHSDASIGTGTASTDTSNDNLVVSNEARNGLDSAEKYKILLAH